MTETTLSSTITDAERAQIERANKTTATPVVFIHGLWLLPSSWDNWAELFEEAGYVALTPDWPDDPGSVEVARAEPEALAGKTLKQVADHTAEVVAALDRKPVIMGHSTGGLVAQMLAGRGLAAATVAIDPGVFRGVLPLPFSVLKGVGPFLLDPRTRGRALTLTFDQFRYGWANAQTIPPRIVSGPSASTASTRSVFRAVRGSSAVLAREVTSSFTTNRECLLSSLHRRAPRAQTGTS